MLKERLPAIKMKSTLPLVPLVPLVPLDQVSVLNLYVDKLTQRNHVVDPVTGLTPIEQRNAFIADLTARRVPFRADVNFVTLAVTVNPDSKRPIVFYFSPNAIE